MNLSFLERKSLELKIDIVSAIHRAQSGHIGAALSCLDILVALYYGKFTTGPIVKFDAKKPGWDKQDYVFLSKGSAVVSLYAILADLGFFDKKELRSFRQINSLLQGYLSRRVPGVLYTAGPKADAFAIACGTAVSLKNDKADNRVFTVLADSELQDGLIWEACMSAAHYRCDNLIAIVDNSGLQSEAYIRGIVNVQPVQSKFEAFGWKVFHVLDGHDYGEIIGALSKAIRVKGQPVCIWAHTVSARGVPFAEAKPSYYNSVLSDAELDELMPILNRQLEDLKS